MVAYVKFGSTSIVCMDKDGLAAMIGACAEGGIFILPEELIAILMKHNLYDQVALRNSFMSIANTCLASGDIELLDEDIVNMRSKLGLDKPAIAFVEVKSDIASDTKTSKISQITIDYGRF
jgi:hypothetical protein